VPDHPVAAAILRAAGPLATTSANVSGQPSLTTPEEVIRSLDGRIDLLVDGGESPGGVPSTVVDCTADPPRIIRGGPVPLEAVLKVWRPS
jgi:L-threonylcarbamoyladenylate synthase